MTTRAEALDEIYAQLPTIDCRGLCWDSCGPLDLPQVEQQRIEKEAGVVIDRSSWIHDGPRICPALGMLHTCTVYDIRPLICRIWGMTKRLPCTYGCVPSRYLSEEETYSLLAKVYDIGGQKVMADACRRAAMPENQTLMQQINRRIDLTTDLLLRKRHGH